MCSMGRQAGSGCGAGRSATGPAAVSTSMLSVMSMALAGPNSRAVSCLVGGGGGGARAVSCSGGAKLQGSQLRETRV